MSARPAASDFLAAAVAASERLLRETAAPGTDPLVAGVSYCFPAGPEGEAVLRRCRRIVVWCFALAVLGWGAALVFLLVDRSAHGGAANRQQVTPLLIAAAVCIFVGLGFAVGQAVAQRRIVNAFVARRFGGSLWTADAPPVVVNIENAATHERLKVMPEDMGLMMLYRDPSCVQIEGVRHRYLVHTPDVTSVEPVSGSRGVTLRYRVGDVELGITLFPTSLGAELRRQVTGGNSLALLMRRTLGGPAPAAPGTGA